jgi:gamma-glutamyltranspeptidase/glutathione hydrolase
MAHSSTTDAAAISANLGYFDYIVNPGPKSAVTGLKAAASTDNAIVTETILKVLKSGGNAVDGAIAGCLVQAAVEPFMTNHTGTVTFLYYEAKTGQFHQLDSAGYLPSGLAPFKPVPPMPAGYAASPPSACIPGYMPGLKAIHERFASKPWAELCSDAIRWAEDGHPVSSFEYYVNTWGADFTTYFPEGRAFYRPDGHFTPVGHRFRPPGMAETLRKVAENGPDHMITGEWARAFVAKANEMDWKITLDHMTETPARWVEPLRFPHRDHEIVSLSIPQQQGPYIALTLGILRALGFESVEPESAEHFFYLAHALRLAQIHCGFLTDSVLADAAVDVLTDTDHHERLARLIKGLKPKIDISEHTKLVSRPGIVSGLGIYGATGRPTRGRSEAKQPTGSCELAIVDAEGNWVQMMNTLQSGGIPGMVIEGIPMVGCHATFGGLTAPIDGRVVKGARLRQCIGNTFVLKDGKPVLSLGSPGNVHCTVPQVLTYLLEFDYAPNDAIAAPRLLPINDDSSVLLEDRLSDRTLDGLASMGVNVKVSEEWDFHMGSFAVCYREEGGSIGAVADPRRCAVADGLR